MVIIGKTQIHCRELGFYPVLSDKASRSLTLTTPFFKLLLHNYSQLQLQPLKKSRENNASLSVVYYVLFA